MISAPDIGAAVVRRTITVSGIKLPPGHKLSLDDCARMRPANYWSMIKTRIIELCPEQSHGNTPHGERHIINIGFGRFSVIEGRKLNDTPLTKEDAQALA
ncbi:MAG: hypothetical protein ACRECU_14000 [Methylocella sp.]